MAEATVAMLRHAREILLFVASALSARAGRYAMLLPTFAVESFKDEDPEANCLPGMRDRARSVAPPGLCRALPALSSHGVSVPLRRVQRADLSFHSRRALSALQRAPKNHGVDARA